ncbi:MAG: Sodium/glucose cotransporter [Verrucomicrobiota bacterium]|jgi:Na+/proline symporter
MFGLHPYDLAVIVGYLVLIAGIGLTVARRVHSTGEYFLGNRKFGKLLMIGQSLGVGTHADQPVGTAGKSYEWGFSGIWFGWKFIFCTPFYWLIAPIFRRLRFITSAEYMEARFGRGVGILFGLYAVLYLMMNMSAMQNGAAKVVSEATGGSISHSFVIWSMSGIFVAYSFLGGRVSSVTTDFFQSILIIVLSVIIVPFGLSRLGGFHEFKSALTAGQLSLAIPGGLTLTLIASLSIQSLFSIFSQPHMMGSVGTGKTEVNCRVGFTYGNLLKRFCTIGWTLVGLIVIAMVARGMIPPLKDAEGAFGVACQHLLGPGFLGVMVASILATNMSTCSAFMVDMGALFVQNVYRPYFRATAPDSHYLNMGRSAGVVMTFGAMGLVYVMPNVLDTLLQSDSLAAFMGVPFVAGLMWPRANRVGASLAFLVGTGVNLGLNLAWHGNIMAWHADIFIYSLLASVVALVVGSLVTKPESAASWQAMQDRLHTPASVEGVAATEAKTRASEAEANGEGLLLVDLLRLPQTFSFRRYRTDLLGFGGALGVVAVLIACAFVIARA